METKDFSEIRSTELLQKSGLTILAGCPALGKTTYALKLAKECAIDAQTPTAYFSQEMTNEQLVKFLVVNACEEYGEKIKNDQLTQDEWAQIEKKMKELYGSKLFIDDSPSITINELCSKCRQMVEEQGIKMVIIDYIQLMCQKDGKEEMSAVLQSLNALAEELNISILALSQGYNDIKIAKVITI
jgi:replicative DNA helicase